MLEGDDVLRLRHEQVRQFPDQRSPAKVGGVGAEEVFAGPLLVAREGEGAAADGRLGGEIFQRIGDRFPDVTREDRHDPHDVLEEGREGPTEPDGHGQVVERLRPLDHVGRRPLERVRAIVGEAKRDIPGGQRPAVVPADAGGQVEGVPEAVVRGLPALSEPGDDPVRVFPGERVEEQAHAHDPARTERAEGEGQRVADIGPPGEGQSVERARTRRCRTRPRRGGRGTLRDLAGRAPRQQRTGRQRPREQARPTQETPAVERRAHRVWFASVRWWRV